VSAAQARFRAEQADWLRGAARYVRSRSARRSRTVRFFAWVMEREADWLAALARLSTEDPADWPWGGEG
jgi:hypothetical protein